MTIKCVNKEKNEQDCPCVKTNCTNHGMCCECVAHHRKIKTYPACLRDIAKK